MKLSFRSLALMAVCAAVLSACGPDAQFARAKKTEAKGKFYEAWEKYQVFAAKYPQHPSAPEAVFRAGLIAQRKFEDCYMASTFYDTVTTKYSQSDPWARWAALQKNNCPDYFPLTTGSTWEDVDSDTKGNNARVDGVCEELKGSKALPSEAGKIVRTYYAGKNKFETRELIYKKKDGELAEYRSADDTAPQTFLKWPVQIGQRWTTKRDNRLYHYEIVAVDRDVTVAAGEFHGCLLVRSFFEGGGSDRLEYYAPGVGRILTSTATKDGEKRITELASYKIADAIEFNQDGKK